MSTVYGSQSMIEQLKLVLLKHPSQSHIDQQTVDQQWQRLNYLDRPVYERLLEEYATFVELLVDFGSELVYLPTDSATGLDSIYTHDPFVISDNGAILSNMGKAAREGEPTAGGIFLEQMGIPIAGSITGDGRLEGGDVLWIDRRTVAVGEGYRTNAEGIRQLRNILGDTVDEVISVPLPHWTGPNDCLHLLSIISPVDHDLAVVYSRLMPVFFRHLLIERGIDLIEVPDEEWESMACNVLALAPRKAIMLSGNPVTQAALEEAGADVKTFNGINLCIKGAGGPTCLTRPLWRG